MTTQVRTGDVQAPDQQLIAAQQIDRLAQQIAARFDPERIYLFGSYAYGQPTPDSDVDLMVIIDTDDISHQASEIRDSLDVAYSLDLLVRTPAYFAERLALGDFFVEQIAKHGKIVYDSGRSTLPEAIAHPPMQGPLYEQVGGAYLNKLTTEWVTKAERDFATLTRELQVTIAPNYDAVCFHAQLCAEKYFKAYLQEHGVRSSKTHELDKLLALCQGVDVSFAQLQGAVMGKLKDYAVDPRYPGTDPTPAEAQTADQNAAQIRAFVRAKLGI
jgi:HEPN domain-containing protein/predicted nucleotidyltransferase